MLWNFGTVELKRWDPHVAALIAMNFLYRYFHPHPDLLPSREKEPKNRSSASFANTPPRPLGVFR
jgi:hypothetical protein